LKTRYQTRERQINALDFEGHQLITDFFQRKANSKSAKGDKKSAGLTNSKKRNVLPALTGDLHQVLDRQHALLNVISEAQKLSCERETIQPPSSKRKRMALASLDSMIEEMKENALPNQMQENVLPIEMKENVLPVQMKENALPIQMKENVLPIQMKENVLPIQLKENVLQIQELNCEGEPIETPKRRRVPLSCLDMVMKAVKRNRSLEKENAPLSPTQKENAPPSPPQVLSCEGDSSSKRRRLVISSTMGSMSIFECGF